MKENFFKFMKFVKFLFPTYEGKIPVFKNGQKNVQNRYVKKSLTEKIFCLENENLW